jgi:integrase
MATPLTDQVIKNLLSPTTGSKITYDQRIAGFGLRITSTGARSFVLNYRTKLGRERRFTIGSFPDWKTTAARTEAIRLRKQIDQGGDPLGEIQAGRAAPTVSDLCDRFEAEYLPRKRPSTQKTYRQQIAAEIRPALGSLKIAEVTFAHVDRLHRAISKRAPYRANRVLATLSRMFSLAIKWQMRSDNPVKGVERNQEHKRRRYLSPEELTRLTLTLARYRDRQSANIISLLLLTGARRGEVLAARWDDFDSRFVTWIKPGATTKQKTEHRVPVNAAATALLKEIRKSVPDDSEWLFPVEGATHRKDVKDAWHAICKASKVSGVRVHDLRHSFASILASEGFSLPIIGELLGHTQPSTTARYAHLYDDPLRAATERVGQKIGGKTADIVALPSKSRR